MKREPAFYEERSWSDDSALAAPDTISREAFGRLLGAVAAAVLGLTLGLGGAFAADAGKTALTWFFLIALGSVGMLLLTSQLELALIGFFMVAWLTFGTPAVAQGQGGGGAQGLKISQAGLVILMAAWLVRRVFKNEGSKFRAPLIAPLTLYLGLCIWSTVNSLLFPDNDVELAGFKTAIAVNIVEIILRFLALIGMLLVAHSISGPRLKLAATALIVPGIVLLPLSQLKAFERLVPGAGYGAFPQVLAMATLASLALSRVGPVWARASAGFAALLIFAIWFGKNSEWVSGWLACVVALIIIGLTLAKRDLFVKKLVVGTVITVALIVVVNFNYFYEKLYKMNFYQGGQMVWGSATFGKYYGEVRHAEDYDVMKEVRSQQMGAFDNDRLRMLQAAVQYADSFPIGIGLGNYKAYNKYYGSAKVWNTTTFTSAHGTYAQVLTELGWPGLVFLLWLEGAVLWTLWRFYIALDGGWEKAFLLGTFAGVAGMFCTAFLGDYLFPAYHNGGMASFGGTVYTWLFAGLGFAIARAKGVDVTALGKERTPKTVAPLWNRPLEIEAK